MSGVCLCVVLWHSLLHLCLRARHVFLRTYPGYLLCAFSIHSTSVSGKRESAQPIADALHCVLVELEGCERRGSMACEQEMGADLSWALRMLSHAVIQVCESIRI